MSKDQIKSKNNISSYFSLHALNENICITYCVVCCNFIQRQTFNGNNIIYEKNDEKEEDDACQNCGRLGMIKIHVDNPHILNVVNDNTLPLIQNERIYKDNILRREWVYHTEIKEEEVRNRRREEEENDQ